MTTQIATIGKSSEAEQIAYSANKRTAEQAAAANTKHDLVNVVSVGVMTSRSGRTSTHTAIVKIAEADGTFSQRSITIKGAMDCPGIDASAADIERFHTGLAAERAANEMRMAANAQAAEIARRAEEAETNAAIAAARNVAAPARQSKSTGRHLVFAGKAPAAGEIVEINGTRRMYTGAGRTFRLNEDTASMGFHPTDVGRMVQYAYYNIVK